MLAVAKTSQPIAKSFDKEILVKVKLDFNPVGTHFKQSKNLIKSEVFLFVIFI